MLPADNDLYAKARLHSAALEVLGFDMNQSSDVVTIFDAELNYLLVNQAACQLLGKQKHELEGKNMIQLFPHLTASDSHRNLLNALAGHTILGAFSSGTRLTKESAKFLTNYYPLQNEKGVYAVIAHIKKVYIP